MHIKKVKINGFATFHDFEIELSETQNVICGTNGTGKTTLFNLIYQVFVEHAKINNYKTGNEDNSYIHIDLHIGEETANILNELYALTYLQYLSRMQWIQNYILPEKVFELVKKLNYFNNTIRIICSYHRGELIRYFENTFCECECKDNYNAMVPFCGHNETDCHIRKIFNAINSCVSLFTDVDKESKILAIIKTIDESATSFSDYFSNEGSYQNNYLHICAKNMEESVCNETINFIGDYTTRDINSEEINSDGILLNFIKNKNGNIMQIINNYLEDIVSFDCTDNYTYISDLRNSMCKHLNDCAHHRMTHNHFALTSKLNDAQEELFESINEKYRERKRIFTMKMDNMELFTQIQNNFTEFTGKQFDIQMEIENDVTDYEYYIVNGDNLYLCSRGELKIISLLCEYFLSNNIIFFDEPCANLSSQTIDKFNKFIHDADKKRQIVIITHTIESITSNISGLIHFRLEKDNNSMVTKSTHITEKDNMKNIFEHREILFSNKCLFVEGYHDYRFFKCFMEIHDINDYTIIILGGCGNKVWEMCEKLKIEYKIIYDFDKLSQGKNNKFDINTFKFCQSFLDANSRFDSINIDIKDMFDFLDCFEKQNYKLFDVCVFISTADVLFNCNKLSKSGKFDVVWDTVYRTPVERFNKNEKDEYKKHFKRDFKLNNKTLIPFYQFNYIYNFLLPFYQSLYKQNKEDNSYFDNTEKTCILIDQFMYFLYERKINKYSTIDDLIMDHFSGNNKNVLVWDSTIGDLEGVFAKMINIEKFDKKQWNTIPFHVLKTRMENANSENDITRKLVHFLKS